MFETKCPICHKKIKIPQNFLHRKLKCPKCKASLKEVKQEIIDDIFSQFYSAAASEARGIRPPWLPKFMAAAGIFLLLFSLGAFLFIKNSWETQNYTKITELAKTAETCYRDREFSQALTAYDALFTLVGDRKIKSRMLRNTIDQARDNYTGCVIQYEDSICASLQPMYSKAREFFQKGGNYPNLAQTPTPSLSETEIQASVQKWDMEETLALYQSVWEKIPDRPARGEKLKHLAGQIREDMEQLNQKLAAMEEQAARRAEEESHFKPAMQKFLKEISPLARELAAMQTRWRQDLNYADYQKAAYHLVLAYEACREDSYGYPEQRTMMAWAKEAVRNHKLAVTYWGYIQQGSRQYQAGERDACRQTALRKGQEFLQEYDRYQRMYEAAEKPDMEW